MRKEKRPLSRWRYLVFFLVALLVIVADQLSKEWIKTSLPEGHTVLLVGFFRITHIHNTGAAFGIFSDYSSVIAVFALIAGAIILFFVFYGYCYYTWLGSTGVTIVLGLFLGGTMGNLIDRFRLGYVTDFIDFSYWPAFNIADSAVTVGVIIFALLLLRHARIEAQ